MNKLITVLDLGSSKIAAAATSIGKDGTASLLALENLYSHGITGGDITDINEAVNDASSIMARLERRAKKRLRNVFVTIKGADVEMALSRGMIPLSKTPREITKKDVARCLDMAQLIKLPRDRVIVTRIVKGFCIDGSLESIANPIGLYGIKLEAEAFIATANQSKIQNIKKCINYAGFILDGIYLSGMASANSILDSKEKEEGVFLLNIGESLTEGLIFKNNMLKKFHIITQGTEALLESGMRADNKRLATLLKKIFTLRAADRNDYSSIVITGRGALLDGIIEEAEKMFKIPARIGIVRQRNYNLNSQDVIIHTSTIGLIDHIAGEYKAPHTYNNPIHKAFRKILHIYESYF